MRWAWLLVVAVLGCGVEEAPVVPYQVPEGATTPFYDPMNRLTTFPDDVHLAVDEGTVTGLRMAPTEGSLTYLRSIVPSSIRLEEAMMELDGFGTTAGVTLHFTEELNPDAFIDATHFVDLDSGEEVPFDVWWTDGTRIAIVEPLFPLKPVRRYAVVVDATLVDTRGEQVWPSRALHALTHGTAEEPAMERVVPMWAEASEVSGVAPDDIVAGTVFTTQSLFDEDIAIRALLDDQVSDLEPQGGCVPNGTYVHCPTTMELVNPLGEDLVLGADEPLALGESYTVPVDVYLPGDGSQGPYPVVFYGHGLGGDRGEARGTAAQLSEIGFAVVALDAPMHGDHPTRTNSGDLLPVLDFFGIDFTIAGLDVRRLRDNFRLAAWDKLQLANAVAAGVDLTGNGVNDLDADQMHWSGHSLGGLMGVALVAQDARFRSAHLSVPGARMGTIVHRGGTFAPIISLMAPPGTSTAEVDIFFPLLQTAIERGEPGNWAPYLAERDVFATLVVDDDIIPNTCGRFMARALGVEHVGPDLQDVAGLPHSTVSLPLSANQDGRTRVLFQYDEMVDNGAQVDATHSHIYDSETHQSQLLHWLSTATEGVPELIAPSVQ